jgi:LysM repeat protein
MKNLKKVTILFVIVMLFASIFAVTAYASSTQDYVAYNVVSGDTLWKIGNKFGVSIQSIKEFNALSSDNIYIGQKINVPITNFESLPKPIDLVHPVISGDTLWKISVKYNVSLNSILQKNGLNTNSTIYIGQKIIVPLANASSIPVNTKPYVTYENYYVKSGDTVWSIAVDHGIPMTDLMRANGLTENSWLTINQKIIIPVHHIPVTTTNGSKYGEYLDWWTQAQYLIPIGKTAKVTDFYSGKSWYIKRTIGASHADVEALTYQDAMIMKSVWGGAWSWVSRPVIIEVDGRRIAAGMSAMPHAGVDSAPALQTVANRSGNYGTGPNLDYIKGNGMDGHVDLHFLNSTTHNTGEISTSMQNCVKIAAGVS